MIAFATIAAFLPSLRNGFVNFDDDRLLIHNPYLKLPLGEKLPWMWSTTFLGHYQPFTWLSLAIDYAAAGLAPFAYHLDSLLWHTAAALLLYSVLVDLLVRAESPAASDASGLRVCAAAGALFWSIHPLRVESVAWVAERRDPISLVFLLLALRAYLHAVDRVRSPQQARRGRAIACVWLIASLLAKAWGMTFFVTLIAIDVYPLRRLPLDRSALTDRRYRAIWREKIPFALIGCVAGAVAWFAQHREPDTMVTAAAWPWSARLLQASYGLCFYVWKTLWPAHLAVLYARPDPSQPWPLAFYGSAVIVAAAVVLIVWSARRHPAIAMASLVYVATVAPVLGLAQSGPQLVADRYTYASSLPFSALLAGALFTRPRGWPRTAARTLAAAVLVALAPVTWSATMVWHDSVRLWGHALATGQSSYVAHMDYGQAVRAEGRVDEAIAHYRIALQLDPNAGNASYNLANALKAAAAAGRSGERVRDRDRAPVLEGRCAGKSRESLFFAR